MPFDSKIIFLLQSRGLWHAFSKKKKYFYSFTLWIWVLNTVFYSFKKMGIKVKPLHKWGSKISSLVLVIFLRDSIDQLLNFLFWDEGVIQLQEEFLKVNHDFFLKRLRYVSFGFCGSYFQFSAFSTVECELRYWRSYPA